MPRKKDRFYARFEGRDRELFSVAEGADGSLAIMPAGTDHAFRQAPDWGDKNPLGEYHISVHRSLQSPTGINISQTKVVGDGEHEEFSCLIKDGKERLLWPIFSVLCPNLSHKRYDPSRKLRRKFTVSEDFNPLTCTLIYHVFAAAKNRQRPSAGLFTSSEAEYNHFKLFVYVCYLNYPTFFTGCDAHLPTSSPTVNRIPLKDQNIFKGHFPDGSTSLADSDVISVINLLNQMLFNNQNYTLMKMIPEAREKLLSFIPIFCRYPPSPNKPIFLVDGMQNLWSPPKRE